MGMPKPITEIVELDLGIFGEVECEVDFFYSPAELQTYDYPGCDEDFDIVEIRANGEKITLPIADMDYVINCLKECRND